MLIFKLHCKLFETQYSQHSPKFSSRHNSLDIIIECHKAAKVFDGGNETVRADSWFSITEISDKRIRGLH